MTETIEEIAETAEKANDAVADAGTKVSLGLHKAILSGGEATRYIADFFHGTWLGHPLHPMLTDLTIGAWTMGSVFDGLAAVTGSESLAKSADILILTGTICSVPTAISGMTDYSTFPERSAKTATWHGILNSASLGLYIWSLTERKRGNRTRGTLLSTLALGLTSASAWLGGHMVYKEGVGVEHSDEFEEPKDWTPICDESRLTDRRAEVVKIDDDKPVMIFKDGDEISVLGNRCSHAGGPLNEGKFHDGCVECPWHDSVFKLADGSLVHGPATQPQPYFETRVQGGKVEIKLPEDQREE